MKHRSENRAGKLHPAPVGVQSSFERPDPDLPKKKRPPDPSGVPNELSEPSLDDLSSWTWGIDALNPGEGVFQFTPISLDPATIFGTQHLTENSRNMLDTKELLIAQNDNGRELPPEDTESYEEPGWQTADESKESDSSIFFGANSDDGSYLWPYQQAARVYFGSRDPISSPEPISETIMAEYLYYRMYKDDAFEVREEHFEEMLLLKPTETFQEITWFFLQTYILDPESDYLFTASERMLFNDLLLRDRVRLIIAGDMEFQTVSLDDPETLFHYNLISNELFQKMRRPHRAAALETKAVKTAEKQLDQATRMAERNERTRVARAPSATETPHSNSSELISMQSLRLLSKEVTVPVPDPVNIPRGLLRWLARFKDPPDTGSLYSKERDPLCSWQSILVQ